MMVEVTLKKFAENGNVKLYKPRVIIKFYSRAPDKPCVVETSVNLQLSDAANLAADILSVISKL